MIRTAASRRGFLRFLPGAAIAGRQAAEQVALKLAQGGMAPRANLRDTMRDFPYPGEPQSAGTAGQQTNGLKIIDWRKLRDDAITKALNTPEKRAEVEGLLYEQFRHLNHVDPDISVHRSFSLAAKLCYQRQRIVEREIEETVRDKSTWQAVRSWRDGVLGFLDAMTGQSPR